MFDSVSIRHTGGEISVTKTVIEHRAPTDDSIRLYGEIKEKAYKSILETIELRDNPINLNAILYYEFESRQKVCKWKFTLNGQEFLGEMKSSRLDFLDKTKLIQEMFKHVSEVIAGKIIKVAIDNEEK